MQVGAALLEDYRFPPAWRGYARSEVDAVLDAIRTTLSAYEARIEVLERQLIESREARDSVDRALQATERDRDAILAEAEAAGAGYRREAEQMLADAGMEAEQRRKAADAEASRLLREAETEAAGIAAAAERDAEEARARANDEAKRLIDTATTEAERVLADARSQAEAMLAEAAREVGELRERVPRLRHALAEVEEHLRLISVNGIEHGPPARSGSETIGAGTAIAATAAGAAVVPAASQPAGADVIPIPNGSGLQPTERLEATPPLMLPEEVAAPVGLARFQLNPMPGPDEEPAADLTPLFVA